MNFEVSINGRLRRATEAEIALYSTMFAQAADMAANDPTFKRITITLIAPSTRSGINDVTEISAQFNPRFPRPLPTRPVETTTDEEGLRTFFGE